jgi:tRNA(Met) C34 N-acetyltransferase TmcA
MASIRLRRGRGKSSSTGMALYMGEGILQVKSPIPA